MRSLATGQQVDYLQLAQVVLEICSVLLAIGYELLGCEFARVNRPRLCLVLLEVLILHTEAIEGD